MKNQTHGEAGVAKLHRARFAALTAVFATALLFSAPAQTPAPAGGAPPGGATPPAASAAAPPVVTAGPPPVTSGAPAAPETTTAPIRRLSPDGKPLVNFAMPPNTPIEQVLAMIRNQTGVTVMAQGAAKGQPVAAPQFKDVTLEDALKTIATPRDWVFYKERGTGNYVICDKAYYEQNVLKQNVVQRVIRTQNIPAADAAKAVERMKTTVGDIQADARTNQIFVTDLLPVVEAIERTIRLLDQRVFLRVFTIKNADPKTVLDVISQYKSASGRLDLVPKMRQIIAEDTYENIQRMEVMVDILDRGPEMRVYDLNNIDFDGKTIQDLEQYLDKDIITEGAYLKFDPQNGVMILIDLPSVHEKVEQILKHVDKPARQIYIQAEIVETNFKHSFELGVNWTATDEPAVLRASGSGGTGGNPGGVQSSVGSLASQLGFREADNTTLSTLPTEYWKLQGGGSGLILDILSEKARATFKAVMEDSETRILAQPRVLVKNQQPATITDGGTISYATTTYYGGYGGYYGQPGYTGYGGYIPSVGSGSVPTGVTLAVDPSIMNNGLIEMRVTLTNVSGTPVERDLGTGNKITLVDTTNQTLDTILVIPDGQTRMIGGMIENRETDIVNGIPFLKDIPWVGPVFFGSRSRKPVVRRTLLMFITPTIVQEQPRKYQKPPDEDEKTPPTFYEQASWSAEAVKRAVAEGLKIAEEEVPAYLRGRQEPEKTGRPVELPDLAPPLRFSHTTETKTTTGIEKAEKPALPVREEPVMILPAIPPPEEVESPASPTLSRIEPKAVAPPTSPTALPAKPPAATPRITPGPRVPIGETSPTVATGKPIAPEKTPAPTPAAKPTSPTATPSPTVSPKPSPTPLPKPTTAPLPAAMPKTTPTPAPAAKVSTGPLPAATPKPSPTPAPAAKPSTATVPSATPKPTTKTVSLEQGPVRVLSTGRRPSDLPEPIPPPLGKGIARAPASTGEEAPELSLYEVTVVGKDGRAVKARATGEMLEPDALGNVEIPISTLTAPPVAAAAPAAQPGAPPPPGAPAGATIVGMPARGTPSGAPPGTAGPTGIPTRITPVPAVGMLTPYGARPAITPLQPLPPPGFQPFTPGAPYRPTPRSRTSR
ncbi:MAG: hypothetical protein N3D11_11200 [Candidatus Sumerlaeia bacterium]|nr:hypothetical protein [Candidatus Sumerlaeia bacterium]